MWKIIKKNLETIKFEKKNYTLWMKWKFTISFASDSFGPYTTKFQREDCYFIDWLNDRWAKLFPLKNKQFDNTEIFLENDDIIICVWERWNVFWEDKTFIDIINIKTEKKYRLFTDEVNVIYNTQDQIVVCAKDSNNVFNTYSFDINTLELKNTDARELNGFFKIVYDNIWDDIYKLSYNPSTEWNYKSWYFSMLKLSDNIWGVETFDRENFKFTSKSSKEFNVWELSN